MPVAIRNLDPSTVSLSSRDRSSDAVTWAPAGDPHGGDVQLVADDFARSNVKLIQAISLGILTTVDDEGEIAAGLRKQAAMFHGRAIEEKEGVETLVSPSATGVVVLSEDEMNSHFDRVAKGQPSQFNPVEG